MSDSATDADQVPAERNTPGSGANLPRVSLDDFPNEVLARILDHVPFLNYIVRMSHLSRRWREVAHAHPSFCQRIDSMYLEEGVPSPARGALFVKQITCSNQPMKLTIMLPEDTPQLVRTLLPLIGDHMHRIASLCLVLHFNYSPNLVFAALNRPAPLLKWLRIDLKGDPILFALTRRVITRTIFGGQSRLQMLRLSSVEFPDGPAPAFDSVERVALSAVTDMSQIQRATESCPNLRQLDLIIRSGTDEEASRYLCTTAVAQLPYIYLATSPSIRFPWYSQLLMDFTGPLCITELFATHHGPDIPSYFHFSIAEKSSRRERRFGENSMERYEEIAQQFLQLDLAERIVEFTTFINALEVIGEVFPTMPKLEVITVQLNYFRTSEIFDPPRHAWMHYYSADENWTNMTWIECPSIRKVVISGDGQSCTTQWLANFMGYTLGATCRRHLELELRGVILDGDPREIWGYFKAIHMTPAATT